MQARFRLFSRKNNRIVCKKLYTVIRFHSCDPLAFQPLPGPSCQRKAQMVPEKESAGFKPGVYADTDRNGRADATCAAISFFVFFGKRA